MEADDFIVINGTPEDMKALGQKIAQRREKAKEAKAAKVSKSQPCIPSPSFTSFLTSFFFSLTPGSHFLLSALLQRSKKDADGAIDGEALKAKAAKKASNGAPASSASAAAGAAAAAKPQAGVTHVPVVKEILVASDKDEKLQWALKYVLVLCRPQGMRLISC